MKAEKHPDPEQEWEDLLNVRHEMLRKLGRIQRKIDKVERLVDANLDKRRAERPVTYDPLSDAL